MLIILSLCNENYIQYILKGFLKHKTLYKCKLLSLLSFAFVVSPWSSQSAPNSLMLHVETGGSTVPRKGEKVIILNGCQGT
jgi:hypothetical protein